MGKFLGFILIVAGAFLFFMNFSGLGQLTTNEGIWMPIGIAIALILLGLYLLFKRPEDPNFYKLRR